MERTERTNLHKQDQKKDAPSQTEGWGTLRVCCEMFGGMRVPADRGSDERAEDWSGQPPFFRRLKSLCERLKSCPPVKHTDSDGIGGKTERNLLSYPTPPAWLECEDYPAEWTVLNEVTQRICRLCQGERLGHDGLDRAGFK